jgi:uncharacterized surface protein with fasciclin (FAS1) repeats
MKGLLITLSISLLLALLVAGCGDAENSRETTGREVGSNPNAMQQDAQPAIIAPADSDEDDGTTETSRSLMTNATANRELTTFTAMLNSSDAVRNLSGTGPYTLFAPAEKAFKALPGSTLEDLTKPENQERLQQLLNNHIIAGKLTTADLQDGAILKTAAGHQLKVSKRDGQVRINGALIEDPDGMSNNGVLHVISKVLVPTAEEIL